MKYPYERFLRFLVSRKIDLNRTLERYGLPRAGDMFPAECRSDLRRSAPYALVQYIDTPNSELVLRDGVLEWATREKILPLWLMQSEFGGKSTPALDTTFRLFINPISRAVLGMLLLSKAREQDAFEIVREQFDVSLDAPTLELYKSIFWDVGLVGRTMWEPFIKTLVSAEEKNYIAFGLTSPSADEIRDLLGMDCAGIDHKTILNQIIAKSYLQYKRLMDEPNQGTQDAMKWAELTLRAITTAKTSGGLGGPDETGPKTGTARFRGLFSVQPDKTTHPTLAQLEGEVGKREPPKLTDPTKADK